MSDLITKLRIEAIVKGAAEVKNLAGELLGVRKQAGIPVPDPTADVGVGAESSAARVKALRQALQDLGIEEVKAGGMAETLAGGIGELNQARTKVANLEKAFRDLGASEEDANRLARETMDTIDGRAKKSTTVVGELGRQFGALLTLGAIKRFVDDSVNEFARAEAAYRGLEAVATHAGYSIGQSMEEANKLAADGLISVADASKSLQNLLARGYKLDQAIQVITRLKDAAAFNRQSNLSMSEAVMSATEGIKNENSVLVDNAGVTKNVAKMWEDYAATVGKSTNDLTQAEKIQAEVNGILAETEAQAGNAATALSGFQGEMAKTNSEVRKFEASFGEIAAPIVAGAAKIGTGILDHLVKPVIVGFHGIGVAFATFHRILSGWRNPTTFFDNARRAIVDMNDDINQFGKKIYSGDLDLQPTMKKNQKATEDAAKAARDSAAQQEADQKKVKAAIQDTQTVLKATVKDYEQLGDQLKTALDKSQAAIQDYRDKAAQLRRESAKEGLSGASQGQVGYQASRTANDLRNQLTALQSAGSDGADIEAMKQKYKSVDDLVQRLRDLASATDDATAKAELQQQADQASSKAKETLAAAYDKAASAEESNSAALKDQIAENDKRLASYKDLLAYVEGDKTLTLKADAAEAIATIDEVKRHLDELNKAASINVGSAVASLGGSVPGRAAGGPIGGSGPKGVDTVLRWMDPNEHVFTADEVDAAGGHGALYRLRRAILAGGLRGLSQGGSVGAAVSNGLTSLPPARSGGTSTVFPNLGQIDINLGGQRYPVYADPDVAEAMSRLLTGERRKRGGR